MKRGLLIDDSNRIPFTFEGQHMTCFSGDTIASALWKNNIKILSRSFKYHRPRGILSLAGYDTNTLVDETNSTNARAERQKVTPGMWVRALHYSGSLKSDRLAVLGILSPFLSPGFYYKAFYKPFNAWKFWEPIIRRLAGLGTVNTEAATIMTDKVNDFCDVAVIGGGPAGISAAISAAKSGQSVCLLDKNPIIGGSLNWLGGEAEKDRLIADLQAQTGVRVMPDWEVKSVFDGSFVIAAKSKQLLRLRAKKVIIATGARSLPAVFINNDLPGIMLTSAAMRLVHYFDLSCGSCAVMLACDETDAIAARTLRSYGVNIAAIFNLCEEQSEWADSLAQDGFAVHNGLSDFSAQGKNSVKSVRAKAGGRSFHINCDCVLMNAGRTPITELPAAAGVVFTYNENLHTLSADDEKSPTGVVLAGAVGGCLSLNAAIADGEAAATEAKRPPKDTVALPSNPVYVNTKKYRGMAFIDFDEDLQPKDFDEAIDEGFDDIQLLKRYTTAGMGPAQGKLGNLLVLRHLARRLGKPASAVGQVTARPPATAVSFAQLAGYHFQPLRLSALHRQHKHLSASFMNAGSWHRPAIYKDPEKEAIALRNDAGIIDVSTLGKMLISGDDAPLFLERLYTGKFQKQKIGTSRYGLMLDESGIIVDDGVIARIDENKFIATTTTASSDNVYRQMLLWKARWQMRVTVINITSAYSAISLSGPRALAILSDLVKEDIADLPHMGVRAVNLKSGVPALLLRTGFVGEKGYEIYLSYGYAPLLWATLLDSAQPCGVEAQRLLRLEKGHIIVGQDTDAMSTPLEADMAWALGKNKEFYLGMRALDMHKKRGLKQKLSGFVLNANWRDRINECDLVFNRKGGIAGRVTSVAYSPAVNKVIGLAYINPEDAVEGQEIDIRADNSAILHATVKKPPFYDPEGERLK